MVHWSVLSSKITPWCELLYYGSFWLGWVGRIFLTQALSHPSATTSSWTSKQVTSFLQNSSHNPSDSSYPTIFQLHFNLQNKVVLCSTHWTVHHQSLTTSASTVPNFTVVHLDLKKKHYMREFQLECRRFGYGVTNKLLTILKTRRGSSDDKRTLQRLVSAICKKKNIIIKL